ncbi:MAG: response regulator [Vicinamibacterales bacterium]
MILALVDDLMFRSKISAAAKGTGAALGVATSPEALLERAAAERPSVILVDLDGQRTEPLEALRRLAADARLSDIPTLGFVSHVHGDRIQEARALGIGEVMARGAFSANLPAILGSYEAGPEAPR